MIMENAMVLLGIAQVVMLALIAYLLRPKKLRVMDPSKLTQETISSIAQEVGRACEESGNNRRPYAR
jgi:hypothetical protein